MKKYWLLSAGIAALATPTYAHAQDDTHRHHRDGRRRPARRRGHRRGERPRDRRHRPGPPPGPPGRAARSDRRRRRGDAEQRRHRHPPAQPARPVAARLLDRHRGQRFGPYPRHRHGRRQSGPRKLGRGVHRRRLPLAQRHRPQRARRGRARRSAARPAGHAVRPQRLGRPDPRHHPAARISTSSAATPSCPTAITTRCAAPARINMPIGESSPAASTRSMPAATAITPSSTRPAAPRAGSTTATASSSRGAIAVRAERRALVPPDRRLYRAR